LWGLFACPWHNGIGVRELWRPRMAVPKMVWITLYIIFHNAQF